MSVDATRWAWSIPLDKSTERLVLLTLADRADETNECYPSMQRVVNDTLLDIKTVKKVITDLIERGLIEDTGIRKGATQRVRVLRLIGVNGRSQEESKRTQKRNEPKNGINPILPSNEPKIGSLNEPKIGTQNLTVNLKENLTLGEQEKPTAKTQKRTVFIKPVIEDLKAYFQELNSSDYEAFFDHFESNGWMVGGKSKMVDWKASARNWIRNSKRFNPPAQTIAPITKKAPIKKEISESAKRIHAEWLAKQQGVAQ